MMRVLDQSSGYCCLLYFKYSPMSSSCSVAVYKVSPVRRVGISNFIRSTCASSSLSEGYPYCHCAHIDSDTLWSTEVVAIARAAGQSTKAYSLVACMVIAVSLATPHIGGL